MELFVPIGGLIAIFVWWIQKQISMLNNEETFLKVKNNEMCVLLITLRHIMIQLWAAKLSSVRKYRYEES